jgi:hypothetical protein
MNRCIVTKYKGPTNTKGSRIVASAYGKRVTFPWDHSEDVVMNHAMAAAYAASKFGWLDGTAWERHDATLPDGRSCAHVFVRCDLDT